MSVYHFLTKPWVISTINLAWPHSRCFYSARVTHKKLNGYLLHTIGSNLKQYQFIDYFRNVLPSNWIVIMILSLVLWTWGTGKFVVLDIYVYHLHKFKTSNHIRFCLWIYWLQIWISNFARALLDCFVIFLFLWSWG